jgi:hypothetical protein
MKENKHNKKNIIVIFIIAMIISAAILKIIQWTKPATQPPLLTQTSGLIKLSNIEDVSKYSKTKLDLPKETFDSEIKVIGIYTKKHTAIPEETVSIVYTKNDWKFVEIYYKPNFKLIEQMGLYSKYKQEELMLNNYTKANIVYTPTLNTCHKTKTTPIGVCPFNKLLIFQKDENVILIGSNTSRVTEGELINIAKSIL